MKKQLCLIAMVGLLSTLVACGNSDSSIGENVNSTVNSSTSSSSSSTSQGSKYEGKEQNDLLSKAQTTYKDANGETKRLNDNTLYTNAGNPHMDSTSEGGQHVLVVPFAFEKDSSDGSYIEPTSKTLSYINDAFKATDEEMKQKYNGAYYSLESFYNHSSYGKANFECDVLPSWVTYTGTASKFLSDGGQGQAGAYASKFIRNYYISEYSKQNHGILGEDAKPLSYYDANKDGYIDLMWIVYSYKDTSGSDWWAYVTYTGNSSNLQQPEVKTLAWAATSFMQGSADSHTFIHETGHTMGLDDYYDYNGKWKPMGAIDYMDQNLGDHNAFSKFQLGWVEPWVVSKEELEKADNKKLIIKLDAFTNTGDCVVIPSPNYNNTAFDEYFIIELVGPTGIAKYDYDNGYESTHGFTTAGIRVLHVDARVYSQVQANDYTYPYLKTADEVGQKGVAWRLDNSYGGRAGTGTNDKGNADFFSVTSGSSTSKNYMPLVSLVEASYQKSNNLNSPGYIASNSSLFRRNSSFDLYKGTVKNYMPSRSALWDKAKTITKWTSNTTKVDKIDETMTCDVGFRVLDIVSNDTTGYSAYLEFNITSSK